MITNAQSGTGDPSFAHPVDIPISLSGNFMELRSDHFHSGLDIRTEGREGLNIRAAEAGWVSRVKVSPWGYGKALYIDHPNGHTTVYGHLRNFTGAIDEAVLDRQYKARSFDVDLTFEKGELPVKKGDLVAHSGNSGGSSGPHLHFEVRRTGDQHALDPERFGIEVADKTPPIFIGLRVDPLDSAARVRPYPGRARGYAAQASGQRYVLSGGAIPEALGTVGLSVNVIDRYDNSGSTCGIRKLKVMVDDTAVYSVELDHVDFGLQRYADAYMDYALFKGSDMHYNRCYKLPNNKLRVYGPEKAQGRIRLLSGQERKVVVVAEDANGNRSELHFRLRGAAPNEAAQWKAERQEGRMFRHDQENVLNTPDLRFTLPAGSLFADEHIRCSTVKGTAPYAPVAKLHDPLTPLYLPGKLSLRVDDAMAKGRTDKLFIAKLDKSGKPSPIGGSTWQDGWISAKVKTFGDYSVLIDTVHPKIEPANLKPVMTGVDSIIIRITDDLSGIDQWSGKLDGQWILFEYDPKRKSIFHRFDKYSDKPGKHELTVEVSDERGNVASWKGAFTR